MKALKTGLGTLAVAISMLAAPGGAGAAPVVPPENSAATQYTEAFPTAGGPKDTGHTEGRGKERSPDEVLGRSRTGRLEAQGAQGRAVAEVVAETAPASLSQQSVDGKPKRSNDQGQVGKPADGSDLAARTAGDSGSSGLGEVAAQATGSSSSGQMGLLLPLLIAAAVLWAAIYWSRQRKRATT